MAQVPVEAFAAATLAAIGQPVTPTNVHKMVAWWQWESGGGNAAAFNPADVIIGAVPGKTEAPGTTAFNTFGDHNQYHVANYTDVHEGVRMTGLYIQSQPKIFHAFDKNVSYQDGLMGITSAMASFAKPQFMQNIQNTPESDTLRYGKVLINHGADINGGDTITGDIGGAVFIDPITSNPFDSTSGGVNPLDAAGVGLFNSPLDFLKKAWETVMTGAFWKRILYVLAGLVLIFMGLAVLAGRLQKAGDLPATPAPVPV